MQIKCESASDEHKTLVRKPQERGCFGWQESEESALVFKRSKLYILYSTKQRLGNKPEKFSHARKKKNVYYSLKKQTVISQYHWSCNAFKKKSVGSSNIFQKHPSSYRSFSVFTREGKKRVTILSNVSQLLSKLYGYSTYAFTFIHH